MKSFVWLVATLVFLSCGTARGDVIYDLFFRLPGLGDGLDSNFNVSPGQTITGVQAIVRETVTGVSASALAAANVNGFGINLSVVGSDGSTGSKTTNTTGGFSALSDGDSTFGYSAFVGGIVANDLGGRVREFSLGTLNFMAPTTGSTTFVLVDPNAGLPGDITTFAPGPGALGLESVGAFRTRSTTLTAVPEPNTLAALIVTGTFAFTRRRRLPA